MAQRLASLVAVFSLFLALAASSSAGAVTPQSAKLYTGPEGLKVTLVRLAPGVGPVALLYVKGSDSALEGLALPCTVNDERDRTIYSTVRAGRDISPLHIDVAYSGAHTIEIYLGGNKPGVHLTYDEKGSAAVKMTDITALYDKQSKDGTLARFSAFDQPGERKRQEQELAEVAKGAAKACGFTVATNVEWKSIPDAVLKQYSVGSYCGAPIEAAKRLCERPSVRALLAERMKRLDCAFGSGMKLELAGGTAHWTTATDASNQEDFALKALGDLPLEATPSAVAPDEGPWGHGRTVGELRNYDDTTVCTDGKGLYVALAPQKDNKSPALFSGNGKKWVAARPPPWGLGSGSFFDPRYLRPNANDNFRGADMRVHSEVEAVAGGGCKLSCGEHELTLQPVTAEQKKAMLLGAKVEENPQQYGPHALLRDDHGRYFYVDKGIRADNEKSFRVFMGVKGKLEPQKLTNVVADSEGEVFSTKKGDLRLVVDKAEGSTWTQAGKKSTLRAVPLGENMPLIYNELGIYAGARLGTPCDFATF